MKPSKSDWILVILQKKPLDRIHIMKALFLMWHRSGREIEGFFHFVPYLYGPCSLEIYVELRNLAQQGLVAQPPHSPEQWTKYYLTEQGRVEAEAAMRKFESKTVALVERTVEEVSRLGFLELLQKVYSEAPDYATNSVVREAIKP
jgi:DNA-binding PadR family transcriptional regulator